MNNVYQFGLLHYLKKYIPIPRRLNGNWIYIGYFLISLFILRGLIFAEGFPTWGDFHYPTTTSWLSNQLYRYSNSWDHYLSTGAPADLRYIGELSTRAPFFFLSGGNVEWGMKFFLVFSLALPGVGMYFMSYSLFKNKPGAFLAGLIYMINPWIIDRFIVGQITLIVAYGIIPIAFTFLHYSIRERSMSKMLIAGIVGSLASIQVHMFFLLISIFAGYLLFNFIVEFISNFYRKERTEMNIKEFFKDAIKFRLAPAFVIFTIILILNAYWLIPLKFVGIDPALVSSHVPSDEDFILLSKNLSTGSALRMDTGTTKYLEHYTQQLLGPYFFNLWYILSVFLIFLFLVSLSYTYRIRLTIFFLSVLILGIILANGINPPLGTFYWYLSSNIPFFSAFRDPSKWTVLIIFSYSYLLAAFLSYFSPKNTSKEAKTVSPPKVKGVTRNLVVVLVMSILVVNLIFPYFVDPTFGRNTNVTSKDNLMPATVKYPEDYQGFLNWIETKTIQNENYRMALFPPDFELRYDWSPQPVTDLFYVYPTNPTVILKDLYHYSQDNSMAWWLYQELFSNNTKYAGKLFGMMGAKYFVFRDNAHPNSYGGNLMAFSNKKITNYINEQEGLRKVYENGNISVYDNKYAFSHMDGANNLTLAVGDRNILNSLSYTNYSFKDPVVFVEDLKRNEIMKLMPYIKYVVIDPNKYNDLFFNFVDGKFIINPDYFVGNKQNTNKYWVSSDFALGFNYAFSAELEKFAFTSGNTSFQMPFGTSSAGNYDLWIRVFKGKDVANGSLKIDNKSDFNYNNASALSNLGFVWIKLGSVNLDKGKHSIELKSEGLNAISKIAIVPKNDLNIIENRVNSLLKDHNIKVINLQEGENLNFSGDSQITKIDFESSNGYVLEPSNEKMLLNLYSPNEDNYKVGVRLSKFQDNADLIFRYIYVKQIHLKEGINEVKINMPKGILLDQLIIFPSTDISMNATSSTLSPDYQVWPANIMVNNVKDIPLLEDHKGETLNEKFGEMYLPANIMLNNVKDIPLLEAHKGETLNEKFGEMAIEGPAGTKELFKKLAEKKSKNFGKGATDMTKQVFKMENPSRYVVTNSTSPLLIFLESYHTDWRMGGEHSIPIWSYANMFIDTKKGDKIELVSDSYHKIGVSISIASLLVITLLIVINISFFKTKLYNLWKMLLSSSHR